MYSYKVISIIIMCVFVFSGYCDDIALLPYFASYYTLRPASAVISKQSVGVAAQNLQTDELLIATDEKGDFLKDSSGEYLTYPRSKCHAEGIWHRTVGVLVFNSKGEMFVQKRSKNKLIKPSAWDISAGGHTGTNTDMKDAAGRELWEELFNENPDIKIDPIRLVRLMPEGVFITNEEGKENATFFLYFLNEQEERLMSLQYELDQEGSRFRDFNTVVDEYINEKNKDKHAAGFLFFDGYYDQQKVPGTPQNLLHLIINSKLYEMGGFTDVIIVLDKDGTATERNQPIKDGLLNAIVDLMSSNIKVVILTGANIENSIDFVVRPVVEKLKSVGLISKARYFNLLYMNGSAMVYIDSRGNIKKAFVKKPFAPSVRRDVFKALAISFIEQLHIYKDFGSKILFATYPEQIKKAFTETDVVDIFSQFIQANKKYLGFISLNNNENRLLSIELNNIGKESSNIVLHSHQLMKGVLGSAEKMLKGKLPNKTVYNYGNDFVVFHVQDKDVSFQEQASMIGMGNPLVIAIGDGRNDYGFLGSDITQGRKLSFFVGKDYTDMPESIMLWAASGPYGSEQILGLLNSLLKKPELVFHPAGKADLQLNNVIIASLKASA
jgi:hydroxymethylpyrimidine pyrophosphatase-like HAD family hydrolase